MQAGGFVATCAFLGPVWPAEIFATKTATETAAAGV